MKKKGKQPNQAASLPTSSSAAAPSNSIIELLLLFAYLLVHFIPAMSRLDSMAPQWFYLAIVDTLVLLYLIWKRKSFIPDFLSTFSTPFSLVYLAFVLWAGASWFYAINPNEMIVCYARLLTTLIAFINISILLKDKRSLFLTLAYAFLVVVAYESLQVISKFLNSFSNENLDELILTLSGNAGNKNIIAASIVIKLPFLLYIFDQKGTIHKAISSLVIFLLLFSLFILNARASYLSAGVIMLIFATSKFIFRVKDITIFNSLKPIGYIVGLLSIAIMLSIYMFNETAELTGKESNYSNPIKRIATISATNEGSSGRLAFWEYNIKYLKAHPFIGAGYGNWKLASIPYDKEIFNDFSVAYHTHNDFLEMGADLGLPGMLLYFSLFVFLILGYIKKLISKNFSYDGKRILLVGLMAIFSYGIDAMLNFPMERPLMQLNFVFATSIYFAVPLTKIGSNFNFPQSIKYSIVFLLVLLSLFVNYINQQVDESFKGQAIFYGDMDKNNTEIGELDFDFPEYPNLAYNTIPIKAIQARYKIKEGQTAEALKLLNQSDIENPYLHYSSFLKSFLYFKINEPDSLYKYVKMTYENRPRSLTAYSNWVHSCFIRKDTSALNSALKRITRYRDEPDAWKSYFSAMILLNQKGDPRLISLADSAIQKFPDSIALFTRIKRDLQLAPAVENLK